jgi:hypothetical protein
MTTFPSTEEIRRIREMGWNMGYDAGLREVANGTRALYPFSPIESTGSKFMDDQRKSSWNDGLLTALEDDDAGDGQTKNPHGLTAFEIHDEVILDGGGYRAFITGGAYPTYVVIDETGVTHIDVKYTELSFISRPTRPLSVDDAVERRLEGARTRCNTCGDHGAKWWENELPDGGALALCPAHGAALDAEHARNARALQEMHVVAFEQVS